MKKITLLIAFVLFAIQGNAQIANGSIAPDFTATDINGNTWTLSDILASGKTVIMDISATWCGPCWNYHNNHTLDDLYSAYGPNASDEVVVLFVEGDPTTGDADLNGLTAASQGDWVSGSDYAIIDDASIGDLYEITYFPTIFRICPNGIVTEIGAASATSVSNGINNATTGCGITLAGVQNNAHAVANNNGLCSPTGVTVAKVKNLGTNVLTSATLNLLENGAVVATKAYSGTINRFATKNISFDSYTYNPASTYTFEVATVNGSPVFDAAFNSADLNITMAAPTTTDIVVKVYTDNWPTEISWKIKNSANAVVASAGPYIGGANGGGADANTTKIHNVTLADNDCYTIELLDQYGDGWSIGNTAHGFEVFADNVSILNIDGNAIGAGVTRSNALTTTALAVGEVTSNKFGIYPNPTSGVFQINTDTAVQVSVVDLLGKIVYKADNITSASLIDLSGFQKGVYVVKVVSDNATSTEKIILK